ncbi:TetR/AcrR family transcriptional regulator [Leisingera daeponensis]|uniref:TetR/AcrR family transcriptional regulator n=1 Tax=Leisingera daeponensis TaxID=405746 RepID=A0ABS7NL44_9RHOB|nr:TetR/AcrR family transcriptional regulator [Leisingera daeponensis]MBY6141923.1 TetR/AcrR family transcriptional regulator [Leisingera daeponensis]
MTDTATRIAAGLEQAFVEFGFAEPAVETLREAAGVSMRTLYKYTPSRDDMVLSALEHRHRRYLEHIFGGLPDTGPGALAEIISRIAQWMAQEAPRGCLFHAAVAAAPQNERLRELLKHHKAEVASRAARAAGIEDRELDLSLIFEGLTQSWPLHGEAAANSARSLTESLFAG